MQTGSFTPPQGQHTAPESPGHTWADRFIFQLYDGRNKAFFFFAGERSRYKNLASQDLITLPIQDFRNGDFRRYTNAAGQMIPLYVRSTRTATSLRMQMSALTQCNGVQNVICPERISPVARDDPGIPALPDNPDVVFNNTTARFNGSRVPGANNGVYSIKGDYIATDRLRFNGLFSRQYFDSPLDWSHSRAPC